jgi:hypothetical protein
MSTIRFLIFLDTFSSDSSATTLRGDNPTVTLQSINRLLFVLIEYTTIDDSRLQLHSPHNPDLVLTG